MGAPIPLNSNLFTLGAFVGTDWAVLGAYFGLLAFSGWWVSRRTPANTTDYFLGGRSVPAWAAAVSLTATSLSAATFVGGPEIAYRGDLSFLLFGGAQIIAILIVAYWFVPAFYRHEVSTVYGLLAIRYGEHAMRTASWMFMLGRVMASGARLYMGALAASLIVFGDLTPEHLMMAIAMMVVAGVFYTFVGGVTAVIWTDVIQAVVFVLAAVAALVFLFSRIEAPWADVIAALQSPGEGAPSKLTMMHWHGGFGSAHTYTLVTALTGWVLLSIGSFGTDQDLAQRVLTCRSATAGARSAIGGVLLTLPITALFLMVGLGLWIYYHRPDLVGHDVVAPSDSRRVFLSFILSDVPPGMRGLMMAGLFASGLSSLNSALNSMASTLVNDVYRRCKPDRDEEHYLHMGHMAVVGWGVILGLFAVVCIYWQRASGDGLINFALGVMGFAYAGLVAVYLAALLTRRGNTTSVIAALIVGMLAIFILKFQPWTWWDAAAIDLAFPWQMTIATAAAFAVCIAVPSSEEQGHA